MADDWNSLYGGRQSDQYGYEPNRLMDYGVGPVTPLSRSGIHNNALLRAPAERPADWAVSSGLAETLSPIAQGYGAGQMTGEAYNALKAGDYLPAAGNAAMAAMAMVPMAKGKVPVAAAEKPGIRAYHGSPHDFDRFSMDHIGKGEGAQAYGYGLYFAENEGVAKSYRDTLSHKDGGIDGIAQSLVNMAGGDWSAAAAKFERQVNKQKAMADAAGMKYEIPDYDMRTLEALKKGQPGRMYEVKINADPEQFLDWDKPLSQQSTAVRDRLGDVIAKYEAEASAYSAAKKAVSDAYDHVTANNRDNPNSNTWDWSQYEKAKAVFSRLRKPVDNPWHAVNGGVSQAPAASAALRDRGIPGIRYLDQGSRGAGEGSRNYVVFDDALIEIMRKYGLMGPMAAGVGANALYGGEQQ